MVRARRGVILGSGGFEKNLEMREKYQPSPITVDWTTGSQFNTGGGDPGRHRRRREDRPARRRLVGSDHPAAVRAVVLPGRAQPARLDHRQRRGPAVHERGAPVRRGRARDLQGRGHRRLARAVVDGDRPALPQPLPVRRTRRRASRSPAAGTSTARSRRPPRSPSSPPRSTYRPTRCEATVERFNGFAASGVDEDFHRGESAYDKYYSDPTVKPNPSLHAIDQGPFYAVKIVPGDLGTKGGLVTDERARVLRPDGSVDPRPVRRRQRVVRRHGPHVRRPRRHHRPRAHVRLPRRRGHRASVRWLRSVRQALARLPQPPSSVETTPTERPTSAHRPRPSRSAPSSARSTSPGPRATCCSTTSRIGATDLSYTLEGPAPAGAAVVRGRRADVPRDRPAAARPARLRHQPRPGRARLAVDRGRRPAADLRRGHAARPGSPTSGTRARPP